MTKPTARPLTTLDVLRRQMPVARKWAYFDHAAVAPLAQPAAETLGQWSADARDSGVTCWPRYKLLIEQARTTAAEMVGAHADEIAFVPNTTWGINLVAEGFPWQTGDNVVTVADEFPSNLFAWQNLARRGVEVRAVATTQGKLDPAELARACDGRTRIVTVSWVNFASGWRNDVGQLAEIAHRAGARFFLDAIQALGALPLDVHAAGVDYFAADGHKWMLGPEGAGLLFVDRNRLDELQPLGLGWNSVRQAGDYSKTAMDLKPSAGRYEGGSYNVAGVAALGASLAMLHQLGTAAIGEQLLNVTDYLCEELARAGATIYSDRQGERRSGIVSFEMPGRDPNEIRKRALAAQVVLSVRLGRLRASPHGYTSAEDIARLVEMLR